jgi:hypothetical protein
MPSGPIHVGDPPTGGFHYEAELAEPVRKWLECWTDVVVEELRVQTIADLVGARETTPGATAERLRDVQPILFPVQLALLDFCEVERTEKELRTWAPHGWCSLRDRGIRPLTKLGYLALEDGVARSLVRPVDPYESLVAVELKLRNWQSALCQAVGYGAFAEFAFMALPARAISDETVQQARRNGVGVLSVDSTVETVVIAERRGVLQPRRRRLASELFLEEHSSTGPRRKAGSPIVAKERSATP